MRIVNEDDYFKTWCANKIGKFYYTNNIVELKICQRRLL